MAANIEPHIIKHKMFWQTFITGAYIMLTGCIRDISDLKLEGLEIVERNTIDQTKLRPLVEYLEVELPPVSPLIEIKVSTSKKLEQFYRNNEVADIYLDLWTCRDPFVLIVSRPFSIDSVYSNDSHPQKDKRFVYVMHHGLITPVKCKNLAPEDHSTCWLDLKKINDDICIGLHLGNMFDYGKSNTLRISQAEINMLIKGHMNDNKK